MLKCSLRWSIWELCFVSACHLTAAISALLADVLISLGLAIVGAVLMSYLAYLRDRIQTYCVPRRGILQRVTPELVIGEQSVRLSRLGRTEEMQLPSVIYFSEFLLVLCFRPEARKDSARAIHLVLWPDSLRRSEQRRLRRYLRFDLPGSLLVVK